MKLKALSLFSLLGLFALASCSMEGSVSIPDGDKPQEELPKDEGEEDGKEEEQDPTENLSPKMNSSIGLNFQEERLYSHEPNLGHLEYADTISGPISVEKTKKCTVSLNPDGSLTLTPTAKGEVSMRLNVGSYYNDVKVDAYDKLTLKVISDNRTEKEIIPGSGQWIYTYDVFLCLDNPELETVADKYYIECEYQATMAESDSYETFTGRIGINSPLFISKDATRDSEHVPALKFRKIRISGIKDTYTIGLPDIELLNHYGDPSIFEFEYENEDIEE